MLFELHVGLPVWSPFKGLLFCQVIYLIFSKMAMHWIITWRFLNTFKKHCYLKFKHLCIYKWGFFPMIINYFTIFKSNYRKQISLKFTRYDKHSVIFWSSTNYLSKWEHTGFMNIYNELFCINKRKHEKLRKIAIVYDGINRHFQMAWIQIWIQTSRSYVNWDVLIKFFML